MLIRRLAVEGFRNLAPQRVDFAQTTVLVGQNGQGKTNLLEATYLLAALRSFRTSKLSETIAFGGASARVRGEVDGAHGAHAVEVRLAAGSRRVLVDDKVLRAPRDYAGDFNAVVFVPEDLALARGAPEGRRRFLDRAVFASSAAHLADLLDYERALRGRNQLLKEGRTGPEEAAQRAVMARLGAGILLRRRAWVAAIRPRLRARFEEIARAPLEADLAYESEVDPPREAGDQEAVLLDALAERLAADRARGFTTAGPHADDLALRLGGHPLRVAGSQGQQRAFVLAMKLAEIAHVEALRGEPPVLLLDDVGSELDETRRSLLFKALATAKGQVIVTTADEGLVPDRGPHLVLLVDEGHITPKQG